MAGVGKGGVVVPIPEIGGALAPEHLASWGLYTVLAKGAVSGVARLAPLPARHPRRDDDVEVAGAGFLASCPDIVRAVETGAGGDERLFCGRLYPRLVWALVTLLERFPFL